MTVPSARDDAVHVLRRSLWPVSFLWAVASVARNAAFDHGLRRARRLPVRVVSIGNLTAGGTGKTPLVVWVCERARALGLVPGVLARGYGRAPGARLNDEGELLAARLPGLPQEQDADRVLAGRRLLARHPVDVVVLDDGFQHRRLERDRDVVCLDAERPFADGRLLPAGDLREPRRALRRADTIVFTRTGGLSPDARRAREQAVQRAAGRPLPMFWSDHRPIGLRAEPSGAPLPLESLRGRTVWLLAAIARPEVFDATVAALGAHVAGRVVRRDHHRWQPTEVRDAHAAAHAQGAVLLTTEKDAVKLRAGSAGEPPPEHLVLAIGLAFLGREPEPEEIGLR